MSNMRLTEKQCFDICRSCIRFLDEKYSSEGGLFRTSVSLTDVRGLRKQVLESDFEQFRDDIDPHLVAELLQVALKEMRLSLFHEVYDQIMDTELDADSIEYSIDAIVPWLNTVPDHKYALADALFALLEKLSTVDDNDTNLIQLGYCMSPVVCRPAGNAFMSIRHMEDLKNIRPIITFMIENYAEIFVRKVDDGAYKSLFAHDGSVRSTRSDSGDLEISAVSASMSTAMLLEASAAKSSPNSSPRMPPLCLSAVTGSSAESLSQSAADSGSSTGLGFFANRPDLKVFVPPLKALETVDSDSLGLDMESDPTVQQYSYSENEWKIFEGLLCAKINTFIDPDDVDPLSRSWSGSTDIDFTFKSSGSGKLFSSPSHQQQPSLVIDRAGSPMGGVVSADDIFSSRERAGSDDSPTASDMLAIPSSSSGPGTPNSAGESTPSSSRQRDSDGAAASPVSQSAERVALRFRRRKMVADCKALRSQIFEFEQEWLKNHGRVPKGTERSPIQTVYNRYKELKKEIRDYAANDMQRCCRGHLARVRLKTVTKFKYYRNAEDGKLISVRIDGPSSAPEAQQQQWARPSNNSAKSPQQHPSGAAAAGGPGGPIGSSQNVGKGVMPNGETSSIPMDVYTNYSELLSSKRDLKRKLKKFDEDFVVQWGRNPRKADKEVIRPMYQKYHEIKTSLDELRAVIESSHGPLPSSLQDDGAMMSGVASSRSNNSLDTAGATSGVESGEGTITVSSPDGSHINSSSGATAGAPAGSGAAAASRLGGNVSAPPANSSKTAPGSMEALQEEKRNLHAYLKVYERDFNKLHGRPVMKHEDIQPVAHEYQRYKELKALIKDVKHTKTSSGAADSSMTSAESGNSE